MYKLELENVLMENISDKHLASVNLRLHNPDEDDLLKLWTKKISGSKMSDIKKRPLTTIGFLLGLVTKEDWDAPINAIPKLSNYREVGRHNEWLILERLNMAIKNEWTDQIDGEERKLMLYDILVDSSAVRRVRRTFAPSATEKYYVFGDKRTFFYDNVEKPNSDIFMLNIDGYTKNSDGSVRQIVEIKSKTGYLGNGIDFAGYMELHLDQVTFYSKMMNTTHGVLLVVDHWSRGMKIHSISQKDIDANWERMKPTLNLVSGIIIATRTNALTYDQLVGLLDSVDWGTEELITKEILAERLRRIMYGN